MYLKLELEVTTLDDTPYMRIDKGNKDANLGLLYIKKLDFIHVPIHLKQLDYAHDEQPHGKSALEFGCKKPWIQKHPQTDLTFGLKIRPKLKARFLKLD